MPQMTPEVQERWRDAREKQYKSKHSNRLYNKQILLVKLAHLAKLEDREAAQSYAEEALLHYVNDDEIRIAFKLAQKGQS